VKLSTVAVSGAVVALAAGVIEFAHTHQVSQALPAALAGLIATGVAVLAVTLPGLGVRGVVTGGFFVGAGMLSWTFIDAGRVVWATLAVEGIVFAVWSWPWLRDLPRLPRLGMAWLGLAYWILGVAGALLVGHLTVTAQRVAYAGVFGLAALAVIANVRRRTGEDLTFGIVSAFLLVIALLLVAGSGNVFDAVHPVPGGEQGILWGSHMQGRFWGGPALLYHPNSIGVIAVASAIRIGISARAATWQRIASATLAAFMVYLVVSRTALLYAGVAAVLHALLLWRRRGADLPSYRRPLIAAALPFLLIGGVYFGLGGFQFATQSRYGNPSATTPLGEAGSDPTSGRMDTWRQVVVEWRAAGWAEKAFGDATTSRAVVRRGPHSPKLTTDNAAVGSLRRGGVLGVVAFLVGLALMLLHATAGPRRARPPATGPPAGRIRAFLAGRDTPPAWFTVAGVGSLATIVTADWLLGGTGGTLWILLLAAEAALVHQARDRADGGAPAPAAAPTGDLGVAPAGV
jgi:hypothetical protein